MTSPPAPTVQDTIPAQPSPDDLLAQIDAVEAEARRILEGLDEGALNWSPAPGSWSMAQCLDHLCTVGGDYLNAIDAGIARGREKGKTGDDVSRPGWFERWFIANLEPPPKRRFKAPWVMNPAEMVEGEVVDRFFALQDRFRGAVEATRGLDVNRSKFRNPYLKFLFFRVGAGLQINLAHERRHLWQAERVRKAEGFPGGSEAG